MIRKTLNNTLKNTTMFKQRIIKKHYNAINNKNKKQNQSYIKKKLN